MEQKDFKMSKEQIEKQAIEEMANDLENHTCMSQFQAAIASRMLYAKGYRKQREESGWILEKHSIVLFVKKPIGINHLIAPTAERR